MIVRKCRFADLRLLLQCRQAPPSNPEADPAPHNEIEVLTSSSTVHSAGMQDAPAPTYTQPAQPAAPRATTERQKSSRMRHHKLTALVCKPLQYWVYSSFSSCALAIRLCCTHPPSQTAPAGRSTGPPARTGPVPGWGVHTEQCIPAAATERSAPVHMPPISLLCGAHGSWGLLAAQHCVELPHSPNQLAPGSAGGAAFPLLQRSAWARCRAWRGLTRKYPRALAHSPPPPSQSPV